MSPSITATQLAALRKRLHKSDLRSLLSGESVSQAVDILGREPEYDTALEVLSLSLTLFRQLRFVFEERPDAGNISDLVHLKLAPGLLPGRPYARLIIGNLEGSTRTHVARATDSLSALGRMMDVLPPPASSSSTRTNPLAALFKHVAAGRNLSRSNLIAINLLLPHVPVSSIPATLQACMVKEMDLIDAANLRCSILSALVIRQTETIISESERDKLLLQPLMSLFEAGQPPNVLLNLTRYLLPSIFSARPRAVDALLSLLDGCATADTLSSWISVASLGVSIGQVDIANLPGVRLQEAIVHVDDSVRLRAFQSLSSSKHMLRQDVIDRIKSSFSYNAVLPSAGARSEFCSAIYAFFKRIRDVHETVQRNGDVQQRAAIQSFHAWLLEDFVDPGLEVACRYPVVRAILSLSVLKLFLDVSGREGAVQEIVYTASRVTALFACQASEFTEVRSRARHILESATIPLPGHERLDTPATQMLLQSCLDSLNHPRKTQAEAGLSALCIIFQKLVIGSQSTNAALDFVNKLGDRLEEHLTASEISLVKGIETKPLHGIIAAVRHVVNCIDLRQSSLQEDWLPVFGRLSLLVDRVWNIARPVISLSRTQNGGHSAPEHEIARAYDVLDDVEGEEDEHTMDHTNLLSGCWRATKEAGQLLAILFSLPLVADKENQKMWTATQIDGAGQRFLTWMHEVRHRGTFSKIALAFTHLADAVKKTSDLKPLCFSWLRNELEIISTDSLSTTRRSAALPYSVLAIVSSDQELLDEAVQSLVQLATVGNATSSDVTKVHAFNILKIVLLDAKQSKFLGRYFEQVVMTALDAFASNNWNVRNVGLIVFSTMVHRSLAPGRGTQDFFASKSTLATRQSLAVWHHKYPSIIPHITSLLETISQSSKSNAHSPLFPILIIVRSLKWSEDGRQLAQQLETALRPYLGSREWQIRIAAAQALSSVVSPMRALEMIGTKFASVPADLDSLHGDLLFKRHLVAEVVDWNDVPTNRKDEVKDALLGTLQIPGIRAEPLIAKAILDLLESFADSVGGSTASFRGAIMELSLSIISHPSSKPGSDLAVASAGESLLHSGNVAYLTDILRSTDEDLQIRALEALATEDFANHQRVILDLNRLVRSPSTSPFAKIAAIYALTAVPSTCQATQHLSQLHDVFNALIERTRCVPLREAALIGLGHSISCNTDNNGIDDKIVHLVERFSAVDQSQPSRYAALKAISPLAKVIYGDVLPERTVVDLHRLMLRLLQDDDETIRIESGELVCVGLDVANQFCQKKAMEQEWAYIGYRIKMDALHDPWTDMVWEALLDDENHESELAAVTSTQKQGAILFEVEPPNLFRDPFVDLQLAADLIRQHAEVFDRSGPRQWKKLESMIASARGIGTRHFSPIDERFDAQRRITKRVGIWEQLLECRTA